MCACVCECMYVCVALCHSAHVGGQLSGVASHFLLRRFWVSDSGHLAWRQVPLPDEPLYQPRSRLLQIQKWQGNHKARNSHISSVARVCPFLWEMNLFPLLSLKKDCVCSYCYQLFEFLPPRRLVCSLLRQTSSGEKQMRARVDSPPECSGCLTCTLTPTPSEPPSEFNSVLSTYEWI